MATGSFCLLTYGSGSPEGHLARFIDEIVDLMDLSAFIVRYQNRTTAGRPPFHPGMMVKILLYSYATGRYSSRKMEAGIRDDLGLRYLAGGLTPDHSSLASFRERHVPELKVLLILVLKLCKEMGLLDLGMVAVDGTKLAANASRAQNVDTDKLEELIDAQEAVVNELLDKARSADDQDARPTRPGFRHNSQPQPPG